MIRATSYIPPLVAIVLVAWIVIPLAAFAGPPTIPTQTSGTTFYPIVPLPDLPTTGATSLGEYVNAAFRLSISIAAILAVLQLMYGGFEYMTKEVMGKKDGKERIRNAIFGLVLLLMAVLILQVINPQILDLNALNSVGGQSYSGQAGVDSTTSTLGRLQDGTRLRPIDPDAIAEARQSEQFRAECVSRGTPTIQYTCLDQDLGIWQAASGARGSNRCPTGSSRFQICY